MRVLRLILIVSSLSLLATPLRANTTILAGDEDNFADPTDGNPAAPSSQLTSVINAFSSVQGFDLTIGINGGSANAQVAHTFTGLPANIASATLDVKIRGGSDTFTTTDGILLGFIDATTASLPDGVVYRRSFGPITEDVTDSVLLIPAPDAGLLGSWQTGSDALLTLDLSNLALADGGTTSLIDEMNAQRFLDVVVTDETAVDFMQLTITVPEPQSLLLTMLVTWVLAGRRTEPSQAL